MLEINALCVPPVPGLFSRHCSCPSLCLVASLPMEDSKALGRRQSNFLYLCTMEGVEDPGRAWGVDFMSFLLLTQQGGFQSILLWGKKKNPQLTDISLTIERHEVNHLSSNLFPLFMFLLFSYESTVALCELCFLDFLLWVV